MLNDVLNILPGLFIIGGIFGTFLGIMQALPSLGGMDLENPEQTKQTMDYFLSAIAFSMNTSIFGIVLSVTLTIFNTLVSPDKLFVSIVERYENSLDNLWNLSENNEIPSEVGKFDADKDPLEALAEEALNKELNRRKRKVDKTADNTPPVPKQRGVPIQEQVAQVSDDNQLDQIPSEEQEQTGFHQMPTPEATAEHAVNPNMTSEDAVDSSSIPEPTTEASGVAAPVSGPVQDDSGAVSKSTEDVEKAS